MKYHNLRNNLSNDDISWLIKFVRDRKWIITYLTINGVGLACGIRKQYKQQHHEKQNPIDQTSLMGEDPHLSIYNMLQLTILL